MEFGKGEVITSPWRSTQFSSWRMSRPTAPIPQAEGSFPMHRYRIARSSFLHPQRCASMYAPPHLRYSLQCTHCKRQTSHSPPEGAQVLPPNLPGPTAASEANSRRGTVRFLRHPGIPTTSPTVQPVRRAGVRARPGRFCASLPLRSLRSDAGSPPSSLRRRCSGSHGNRDFRVSTCSEDGFCATLTSDH